jgi:Rrf2 family protein
MSSLLGISEAASIGWHAMIVLAAKPDDLKSTAEIAEELQVSGAHLSKVLQRLTRAGLVEAVRGPKGGFRLGKPAKDVTVLEIYEVIEGPLQEHKCLLRKPICNGKCCIIGDLFRQVDELKGTLAGLSLEEATKRSLC